jgi:hypothetical protein
LAKVKIKKKKTYNLSRITTNKQVSSLVSNVRTIVVPIDNHMAVIQVQIRKNIIKDVLLDAGSRVNIIIEQLRLRLGLLIKNIIQF